MDSKELRNLQEAYLDVYQEQQLDESDDLESLQSAAQKSVNKATRPFPRVTRASASIAASKAERTARGMHPKAGQTGAVRIDGPKPSGSKPGAYRMEQVDIYDIILSHLLDEGYAETAEAAEVIMVNMSEDWRDSIVEEFEELDEAEGSYGQTPKATAAYGRLGNERRMRPAKEYPQRGAKKKAVSDAETHEKRSRTTDAGNRGKKSTKPSWHSYQRHQMTQSDRDRLRGQSEYGHIGYDPDGDGGPSGPGGKPKGKKLERQRKTGTSAD